MSAEHAIGFNGEVEFVSIYDFDQIDYLAVQQRFAAGEFDFLQTQR